MRRSFFPSSLDRAWLHYVLLATLLLWEFSVFDSCVRQFHAWVYPRWNDQIQYLTEAYTSYETLRTHGWWAGLRESATNPAAQGTLHDILAVIVFAIVGPSRIAALHLNFGVFALWQIATFILWRRVAKRWTMAWIGLAFLLCLKSLTEPGPGSPIDFRLDWLGACMTGIAVSFGALTDGFRRRGWAIVFGVVVGIAIVARFLTVVYFGAFFATILCGIAVAGFAKWIDQPLQRTLNLLFAASASACVWLPPLWANREWVYNYYWIGHLTGPESAIRSPNFGLSRSVEFIFRDALYAYHIGPFATYTFLVVGGVLLILALVCWLRRNFRAEKTTDIGAIEAGLLGPMTIGALMVLLPGVVLVLHSQKSHLVVSVLLPGAVLLATGLLARCTRKIKHSGVEARISVVVAIASVAAGMWHFRQGLTRSPHSAEFIAGARKVNELADYIFTVSNEAKLASPRIGVDQVTDSLDGQIMRVVTYERHQVWVPYLMTLPTGIGEDSEANLFAQLADSDFVFLTDHPATGSPWPYDRQMQTLYPRLKAWCETHLQLVETFPLFDREMSLYQKKTLPVPHNRSS